MSYIKGKSGHKHNRYHVTREADTGVMQLQPKEHQGSAATSEAKMGLILGSWPPKTQNPFLASSYWACST